MNDKTAHWIARHLPKRVVYWCAIVLGANATQGGPGGEWSGQIVPDLLFMDALDRWGGDDE